jgi:hypothetical protein
MGEEMKCLLFRRRVGTGIGKEIGYCDIEGNSTTCEGDVSFCEKPDALREYFRKKLEGFKKKEKKED